MTSVATRLAHRRNVLRGAFGITVGLPFLDCFLNSSGTAFAATAASLPIVFGTWWRSEEHTSELQSH